jgi:hypothetical protein
VSSEQSTEPATGLPKPKRKAAAAVKEAAKAATKDQSDQAKRLKTKY